MPIYTPHAGVIALAAIALALIDTDWLVTDRSNVRALHRAERVRAWLVVILVVLATISAIGIRN